MLKFILKLLFFLELLKFIIILLTNKDLKSILESACGRSFGRSVGLSVRCTFLCTGHTSKTIRDINLKLSMLIDPID